MNSYARVLLLVALALSTSSCTAVLVRVDGQYKPFEGTKTACITVSTGYFGGERKFPVEPASRLLFAIDVPLCAVLDTLFLPLDVVLTYLLGASDDEVREDDSTNGSE